MAMKKIDLVVVGADRIAANGDTANKVGTYNVAIIAKEHGIPFYVAAPTSTFNIAIASGGLIPIEERDENEVAEGFGKRKNVPEGVRASIPAHPPGLNVFRTLLRLHSRRVLQLESALHLQLQC